MVMNPIHELADLLSKLPGIGPRQSKRIVYSLLTRDPAFLQALSSNILRLREGVGICSSCMRFFQKRANGSDFCSICSDPSRDRSLLMLVSRDIDLDNIERSGAWNGLYFVLGGTVPILEKEPEKAIRQEELLRALESRARSGELKEMVFALNANPEGDNTKDYLERKLVPLFEKFPIKRSTLGRGLSTGSELEYSDKETLRNALRNRQ